MSAARCGGWSGRRTGSADRVHNRRGAWLRELGNGGTRAERKERFDEYRYSRGTEGDRLKSTSCGPGYQTRSRLPGQMKPPTPV